MDVSEVSRKFMDVSEVSRKEKRCGSGEGNWRSEKKHGDVDAVEAGTDSEIPKMGS